jgi:hypothetical protein
MQARYATARALAIILKAATGEVEFLANYRRRNGRGPPAAFLGAAALLLVDWSSARAQAPACNAPAQPMVQVEMMFGRDIGGRLGVSETTWSRFLAQEVTTRFPDGLSVIDAAGQWQDKTRSRVIREPSKLVTIVTADDAAARDKIDAIAQAYKKKFRQQSVGIVTRTVCAAF